MAGALVAQFLTSIFKCNIRQNQYSCPSCSEL